MNFKSLNFYFSSILLVLVCIFIDTGVKRILLLFKFIIDPLQVKAEEYEPATLELKNTSIQEEEVSGEVNNLCKLKIII
jgi:hypothetical protein